MNMQEGTQTGHCEAVFTWSVLVPFPGLQRSPRMRLYVSFLFLLILQNYKLCEKDSSYRPYYNELPTWSHYEGKLVTLVMVTMVMVTMVMVTMVMVTMVMATQYWSLTIRHG